MRYKRAKKILEIICAFVGISALFGSICMFVDPSGDILKMNDLLPYFKAMPFSSILFTNYIFSGISLLIVNGITNLTAFCLLIKNKKSGIILGTIFGLTLMLWIIIEFIILPLNILSISYFIIGLIQLVTGYITYVFYMQEQFMFEINKYPNIGKNKNKLVVYFSRMGYTKKIAYEIANSEKSEIIEIKAKEKISNTSGFWWCGRYGMHKWRMPIEDLNINTNNYSKIIIVSPIWVFNICAPVREFCYKYSNKINNVEYILTHFMKKDFKSAAYEMDEILNIKSTKLTSVCIRFGKTKKVNIIKNDIK